MIESTIIYKYFPDVTEEQKGQFDRLHSIYTEWNSKINVISRKDMDNFYMHHALHSLAIARFPFPDGAKVLDVGTGGGFPGIPLAIMFPNVHFTLCDSIGKKIKVATEVANELGLKNVTTVCSRVEALPDTYDYIACPHVPSPLRILILRRLLRAAFLAHCIRGCKLLSELSLPAFFILIAFTPRIALYLLFLIIVSLSIIM